MVVILTSPVEGLQPGEEYTGPNEKFLLQEGYARKKTTPKRAPKFLKEPEAIDYEHPDTEDTVYDESTANVPRQRRLPVDPLTAVQTGHPADPTIDDDENHMPSQSDVVKKEVTGATEVVGDPVPTPSEETAAAADALSPHPVEAPANPEEESGPAPAVSPDELANKSVPTVNENPINYADPEPVEQPDLSEVKPNETAADADGIGSEEEREIEQPEAPSAEDVQDAVNDAGGEPSEDA